VLLVITVTLVALAAVNAVFVTWATALDAKHSSALARALGATPRQVSSGLSVAQVLPALAGAALGHPRRPRTLRRHRRRRRRGDRAAALAAARRGAGNRARRGHTHHHPRPPRRPPTRRAGPPSRTRLTDHRTRATAWKPLSGPPRRPASGVARLGGGCGFSHGFLDVINLVRVPAPSPARLTATSASVREPRSDGPSPADGSGWRRTPSVSPPASATGHNPPSRSVDTYD
jgi:hypothetical protein